MCIACTSRDVARPAVHCAHPLLICTRRGLTDAQVKLEKDWVLFRIPYGSYVGSIDAATSSPAAATTHVSVSRRGAIVIVNGPLRGSSGRYQLEPLLADPSICPAPLPADAQQSFIEDLTVVLQPAAAGPGSAGSSSPGRAAADGASSAAITSLEQHASSAAWSRVDRSGDLVLRASELSLDAVRILNSCLSQTVNLQYFETQVDAMYSIVGEVHRSVEAGDPRGAINTQQLYKHLGSASSITNAVMLSGLRSMYVRLHHDDSRAGTARGAPNPRRRVARDSQTRISSQDTL